MKITIEITINIPDEVTMTDKQDKDKILLSALNIIDELVYFGRIEKRVGNPIKKGLGNVWDEMPDKPNDANELLRYVAMGRACIRNVGETTTRNLREGLEAASSQ